MTIDLQHHLLAGERILWQGAPAQGLRLRAIDALLIPFSLLWAGFAVFGFASVWLPDTDNSVDLFFVSWGLPLLAFGAYVTVGRFIHDAVIRKRTLYAVTTRRLLIIRTRRTGDVLHSYGLHGLPTPELQGEGKNHGSIVFDRRSLLEHSLTLSWTSQFGRLTPALLTNRFDLIENPRQVHQLIQQAARSA